MFSNVLYTGRMAFDAGILAFLLFVIYTFAKEYRATFDEPSLTRGQRAWRTCYLSGTILWSKMLTLSAVLTSQLDNVCDLLGLEETKTFFNAWIGNPQALSAIFLTISAITFFVRMRRSSHDPIVLKNETT